MKKNVLGVITARGGSKGIPNKNVKDFLGKPLIASTIEVAKKSDLITTLVVSTDDEEIAEISRQYGAEVPFMRPKDLAEDTTPHLPVLQHALKEMEQATGIQYDAVVILQPTSPLRTVEDLDATIQLLLESDADSAVSLIEVETKAHPTKIKQLLPSGEVKSYVEGEFEGMRRQDLPTFHRRSGDAYVMTRACLLDKNCLYGDRTLGYVVKAKYSIDIDEPVDWVVAEFMAKELGLGGTKQ